MTLRKKVARLFNNWLEQDEKTHAPRDKEATFALKYEGLTVGILSLKGGTWRFHYTDEFRQREDLRSIVEFPNTDRTYESQELWPFFATRIPSTKQEAIQKITRREEIDITDEVQLLKRFGRQTIANPYQLLPAQ